MLRRELADRYEPGQRFPSQNELAERFGLAATTVREAVGMLVQEGLLERRRGSGTYVTGRRPESYVGVLIELDISHPATSYHWLRTTQSLRRWFDERGFRTRLYAGHTGPYDPTPDQPTCPEFWTDLRAGRIKALAVVCTQLHGETLQEIAGRGIPFFPGTHPADTRLIDGVEIVRRGARALIEANRTRLAFVERAGPGQASPARKAFVAELEAAGLDVRPHWLEGVVPDRLSGPASAAFRRIWEAESEKPDGLMVTDDTFYDDIASLLLANRIAVPEQLAVACHTNKGAPPPPVPPSIRVEIDPDELARLVGENLVLRMANPDAPATGLPVSVEVIRGAEGATDYGLDPARGRGASATKTEVR